MQVIDIIIGSKLPLTRKCICWISFLILGLPVIHGQHQVSPIDRQQLDTSIIYGRLPNGFTYYIKHIENIQEKLDLRFYVNVGYYHENAVQGNFAHAIEHLAIRKAKRFSGHEKSDIELLNMLGIKKSDILGNTGDVYTSYSLDISSKRMDALDVGLQWFRDIADLKLDAQNINIEKGPLRQEFIYRQGNDIEGFFLESKLRSTLFSCIKDWSNFFEHNKNFAPSSLINFYEEWYRPDRMAVVIVGDISDLEKIEGKVKVSFSDIQVGDRSKFWSDCRYEFLNGPKRFVALESRSGKEDISRGMVGLYLYMRDMEIFSEKESLEGLKRKKIGSILSKIINGRFKDISGIEVYMDPPTITFPAYSVRIKTNKKEVRRGLREVIRILKQIKKYGFTTDEWTKIKEDHILAIKQDNINRMEYWIDQIKAHYLYGEILPKNKALILQQWVSGLSLDEFNRLSRKYLSFVPDDIGIIGNTAESYNELDVRRWIDSILAEEIMPYIPQQIPKQLMNEEEISVLKEKGYTEGYKGILGTREFLLDNGVKVVINSIANPSSRFGDRIMLHGFRPKGASCFPKEDYFSAINSPSIVKNMGVGNFNKNKLDDFLSETSFGHRIRAYVDYFETGIKGDSTLEDFEKMLQLIYLYFTYPRKDKANYEDWKIEQRNMYLNPSYGLIAEDFNVAIRESLRDFSVSPRGTKRFQGIQTTDLNEAYSIYQQLFGDAKDFTFLISGNFSMDSIVPLLNKYLGNLPNLSNLTICSPENNEGMEISQDFLEFFTDERGVYYEMKSVLYSLNFMVKTDEPFNWKEHIKVKTLGFLLESKIRELRYSKNASLYNSMASGKFNRYQGYYVFEISLDCVSEELENLRRECKSIIEEVKSNSFSMERFNEVYDRFLYPRYVENQSSLLEPSIMKRMYEFYRYNVEYVNEPELKLFIKNLTPEDIQETAQKYLKDKNMMEFVMRGSHKGK